MFIHLKKLSNLKQKLKIKNWKSEKQSNSIDWQPLMDDCWIKHYYNFEANPPTKQFYPCRPKHSRSNHSSCHQLGEFNKEAKNSKRLKLTVDRIHSPTIRISSNPVRKKNRAISIGNIVRRNRHPVRTKASDVEKVFVSSSSNPSNSNPISRVIHERNDV